MVVGQCLVLGDGMGARRMSDCCVLAGSLSDPKKQTGNHTGAEFRQDVGREMLIG